MSRSYVVVGSGVNCFNEKQYVGMMLRDNVYVAFLGNSLGNEPSVSTGKETKLKPVHFEDQTVWMNGQRWKGYKEVRSLIESGQEVVFVLPEKGGKHFYRGVASKPVETSVPYLSEDTYWGEVRKANLHPVHRRWEEEHKSELAGMVGYQVVFPIDRWERVEATEAQTSVLVNSKGRRITWRGTFQVLKVPSAFSLSSTEAAGGGGEEASEEPYFTTTVFGKDAMVMKEDLGDLKARYVYELKVDEEGDVVPGKRIGKWVGELSEKGSFKLIVEVKGR
jgi:hypothetical protein